MNRSVSASMGEPSLSARLTKRRRTTSMRAENDAFRSTAAGGGSVALTCRRMWPDFSVVFGGYAGEAEHQPRCQEVRKPSLGAYILRA